MAITGTANFSLVKQRSRIDAEYFMPKYIEFEKEFAERGEKLTKYIKQIIQPTEFIREYIDSPRGIKFWRAQNIRRGYIDERDIVYISPSIYKNIPDAHIKEGDLLITRTGANAGDCAVVPPLDKQVAVSSHSLRLVPDSPDICYPISAFFASETGRSFLFRTVSGSSRYQITKSMLDNLYIPDFSKIKRGVKRKIIEYYEFRKRSTEHYKKAKKTFSNNLNNHGYGESHTLSYKASFSNTLTSDRLDAEYFHPEYLFAEKLLSQFDSRQLSEIAKLEKGKQARSDLGKIPYVSIKDINGFILETDEFAKKDDDPVMIHENDIVLAITGATIGKSAINTSEKCVAISGDLLGIRSKKIPAHYLLIVIDSSPFQLLCQRNITGTTNGHLSPNSVAEIPIPILDDSIISSITKDVKSAIGFFFKSKLILSNIIKEVEEYSTI